MLVWLYDGACLVGSIDLIFGGTILIITKEPLGHINRFPSSVVQFNPVGSFAIVVHIDVVGCADLIDADGRQVFVGY